MPRPQAVEYGESMALTANPGEIAMTTCAACELQVSSQAPTCPHCGHPVNPFKSGATMVLVLGIVGVVIPMYGLFLGPIAWALGNREIREIDAGVRMEVGRRKARAGRVLGIVGTVIGAAIILFFVIALGLGNN